MKLSARLALGASAALAAVGLTALPATAVLDGTVDTADNYPNVGLVLLDGERLCTGTLFRTDRSQKTSNLVMTAGHCTSAGSGQFSFTLDANAPSAASVYYTGVAYTHPDYAPSPKDNNSLQQFATSDVGVIVLDRPVKDVVPADLPTPGLVDSFDFKTQQLTVVGYGISSFDNANTFTYGPRTYKDLSILEGQRSSIADAFLKESAGPCFGDSGGPNFVKGTHTIAAVSSWGQSWVCGSTGYGYRIDSVSALNFLHNPTTGVRQ